VGHTYLASLAGDTQTGTNTDHRHGGFTSGSDDFDSGGPTWFADATSGKEGPTPDCGEITDGRGCQLIGQTPHRSFPRVEKACLARQSFSPLAHAHHIQGVAAVACGLHDRGIGRHSKDVADVFPDALCRFQVIKLYFDRNVTANDVQPTGESENGGEFRNSLASQIALMSHELIFDSNGEGMHSDGYLFAPKVSVFH
jgi:hypothetical protein